MTIHAGLPRSVAADALPRWNGDGSSRIPYWAYTDPGVYQRELERFFHGGDHWCYVALEAELPKPGDYKLSYVGERQVIVVRDRDGSLNAVENRCAHRGVRFCQKQRGNARNFVCPYHQWTYKLNGDLAGLPFRHGVKQEDGSVQGGMPADFDLKQHGLTKLKVATYNGLVFASFSPAAPALEDYFGPDVMPWLNRIFDGRKLTILGTNRQRIPGNWKLMMENIKDPYHPGLLHTWFVTFGLWRADQQSRMVMDSHGRHAVMISQRNAGGEAKAVTEGVTSFKKDMALNDPRLLDVVPEYWWKGPTVTMITLFPSVIIQQQVNSLSTRHIIPAGPDAFDFVWTHFGFEEDDEAMTRRRLRQANLFGPAGFVSADDGEVIEFSQDGFRQNGGDASTICELDGRGAAPTPHMVTETLIRGMYGYWRKVMEI
ncbi:MAG: aromatic ring-hydroxylating dioxygenase subunit alpha [Ferrovibrio sp.]|uniref:aromatic ring-hydroxylating dioxygenase subunit alpha n=1 Tax=Ferrovibrio sp. TaxID=1917215 RepID=UPI00391C0018